METPPAENRQQVQEKPVTSFDRLKNIIANKETGMNCKRLIPIFVLVIPFSAQAISWQSVLGWFYSLNNENSAWSVVTKQTAVSSNQVAANDVRTAQMLALSIGAIKQTEHARKWHIWATRSEFVCGFGRKFGHDADNGKI